ncbi:MAG: TIGR03960 family B12-binding radical SAM protein [Deltaproteobacteria bacterium]|nr:TIGR03960 family B12-binding radical SAM protein [Deltaproteobacteria bacterium]
MALAFPDTYEIGMSHLGTRILYSLLAREPGILAERVFAPWPDMERALGERGLELCTLESGHALREFHVVGFSLQFELTYTNVLLMLELGGIPPRSADRGDDAPLVIAGGPTATHPEPLAPFVDAFVIGDGERKLPELLHGDAEWRGLGRSERLRRWAMAGSVYVPVLHSTRVDPATDLVVVGEPLAQDVPATIGRAVVGDLADFPFPSDGPVASTQTVFDRASIEIARGCTEGCRFCQAGMIYRPVRERDPRSILESARGAVHEGGWDEVSLTSLSTADYSAIGPLVARFLQDLEPHVGVGVSSLRAYGLGETVLDDLSRGRCTGLTFAPEAGTQRLRDVINKNVTEEQLIETAQRVFSRGWQKMKLYFMIGLPTETEEDVRGIAETASRAAAVGRKVGGRRATVTVSASTFVPKPHTPFQWAAMDSLPEIERKQAILHSSCRQGRLEVRTHDAKGSMLEGIFARGDRRLADVLEAAYRLGCRFDSWDEHLRPELWELAFSKCGVDPARYLGALPVDATLPWSHIDVGLEGGFLAKEWQKALRGRLSPPCGKPVGAAPDWIADDRKLVCYDCGVDCDLDEMRADRARRLVQLGAPPPLSTPAASKDATPTRAETHRYRLRFEKTGSCALMSHLDLVRNIPRAFRRAGIPMAYSQGFHPKPRMTLSPALSLGIRSLGEILDIVLAAEVDLADLPARLSAVSAAGLRFSGARELEPGDPAVGRVLVAARYRCTLPRGMVDEALLSARLESVALGEPLSVTRTERDEQRVIDVSRFVEHVSIAPADRAEVDAIALDLRLAITGSGAARPSDVLTAMLGPAVARAASVVRLGFDAARNGGPRADPLDLEALR